MSAFLTFIFLEISTAEYVIQGMVRGPAGGPGCNLGDETLPGRQRPAQPPL